MPVPVPAPAQGWARIRFVADNNPDEWSVIGLIIIGFISCIRPVDMLKTPTHSIDYDTMSSYEFAVDDAATDWPYIKGTKYQHSPNNRGMFLDFLHQASRTFGKPRSLRGLDFAQSPIFIPHFHGSRRDSINIYYSEKAPKEKKDSGKKGVIESPTCCCDEQGQLTRFWSFLKEVKVSKHRKDVALSYEIIWNW